MNNENFLIGSTLFTNNKNINALLNQTKNEIQSKLEDKKEKVESEITNFIQNDIQSKIEEEKQKVESEVTNFIQNEIQNKLEDEIEEKKREIENVIQNKINNTFLPTIELNKIKNIQDGLQASLQHFQNGMNQINNQYPNVSRPVSHANSRKPSITSTSRTDDTVIDIPQSEDNVKIVTTRNRKIDRKNLANDILAELPISFRVNDSILIDNNETLENYIDEWKNWNTNGQNKLDILIERINIEEQKYKDLSKFNVKCAKSIQFCLLALGSIIVYIQASGGDSNLINKFTIASGAGTTIASSVLTYFGFPKKGPHYGKVYSNLNKLKCWIDSKLVLPIEKRFSPYDIYAIAKKAFDTIIFEAKDGLQDHK